jgi:hypothetical protein
VTPEAREQWMVVEQGNPAGERMDLDPGIDTRDVAGGAQNNCPRADRRGSLLFMRWISTGTVGAAASAASVFVSAGAVRDVLVAITVATAILLAYWGARSDRRVEEAHRHIVHLKGEVVSIAARAEAAHAQAERPIWERRNEEFGQIVAMPLEDSVRRAWAAARRLVVGGGSRDSR